MGQNRGASRRQIQFPHGFPPKVLLITSLAPKNHGLRRLKSVESLIFFKLHWR